MLDPIKNLANSEWAVAFNAFLNRYILHIVVVGGLLAYQVVLPLTKKFDKKYGNPKFLGKILVPIYLIEAPCLVTFLFELNGGNNGFANEGHLLFVPLFLIIIFYAAIIPGYTLKFMFREKL